MRFKQWSAVYILFTLGLCVMLIGCGTTEAQKKGSTGAVVGALSGLAIGSLVGESGTGALIGTAVGGGLGYIAGNEEDKKIAKEEAAREREALAKAKITKDPNTAYRPPNENPFVGSTWRVLSIVSKKPTTEYQSMVLTFQTNTKLTTLTISKNGKATTRVESYRVVDDVIVISGKDYIINAKYSIQGKQLIIVAPEIRIVMEEIEEKV